MGERDRLGRHVPLCDQAAGPDDRGNPEFNLVAIRLPANIDGLKSQPGCWFPVMDREPDTFVDD